MGLQERLEQELGTKLPHRIIETITTPRQTTKEVTASVDSVKGKGAEYFIEALAEDEFKREVKEYIEAYVELKVAEKLSVLFKAKEKDVERSLTNERNCYSCGASFIHKPKRGDKGMFCSECNKNPQAWKSKAIRSNWNWLMKNFPTLGAAIMREKSKTE